MAKFVNRTKELETLEKQYKSNIRPLWTGIAYCILSEKTKRFCYEK